MKKLYLILKILLILAALIALGYLVTTPDSEVILKRPWLEKGEWFYSLKKPWLDTKDARLDICENCQKEFGDLRIEVKDVREDDYADNDGIKKHGNVAELSYVYGDSSQEETVTVYEGQRFEIGIYSVLVEKVDLGAKADPGLTGTAMGGVTLRITKGDELFIGSNTQGSYRDLRIGIGNIKSGEYEIDGVKKTGVTATLWISIRDKSEENKTITVYIGQSFEIDRYKITVHDIHGELVTLRIWDISNEK